MEGEKYYVRQIEKWLRYWCITGNKKMAHQYIE